MAEFVNTSIVTVPAGQNVPLTETAVTGKPCIVHREGAGIVTLRGLTQQCKARFRVAFGANIAIPTGGAVGAITAALAINGEALNSAGGGGELFQHLRQRDCGGAEVLLRDGGDGEHQRTGGQLRKLQHDR